MDPQRINATAVKFGDPATRLGETDRWLVLVRPQQPTLGSLVLVCKEPVTAFSAVSERGFIELRCVVRQAERMLREVVDYERINYLMLMMVDPDVHFHVIPRYREARTFEQAEFHDAGWPKSPALESAVKLDDALRDALVLHLRAAWLRAAA